MHKVLTLLVCSVVVAAGQGRQASDADIKAKDITVMPSGAGLPVGHGDAATGKALYKEKCAVCHNDNGEGREGQYPALVGGIGTLKSEKPVKTVGSYWPTATTIFDYVRRAMPYDHPRSLSADQVYSLSAFILFKNGIVTETQDLSEKSLPLVKMPNRDGFVPDSRPDVKSGH